MSGPRIAIVGATGAVGRELLRILVERDFPAGAVRVCASERSWGKSLPFDGRELTVEDATPELLGEADIVFIAASGDVSRALAPLATDNGAVVVDKSSAFRMDPAVPLVIPEINGEDLAWHRGIVASPNCSTTPLAMVLKALIGLSAVDRVIVDTYQSVSGAGAAAVGELRLQSAEVLDGGAADAQALPHQIAFNVLPHVDPFLENGYTTEEMKMVDETRKILHEPDLALSATCVRVPVTVGHSEAVHIEFRDPVSVEQASEALSRAPGVRVLDEPDANVYPMPIHAEGHDDVLVGRIRRDVSHPRGLALWLSSDNLRKGAALNSIQIAEELVSRELLTPAPRRNQVTEVGAGENQHFAKDRRFFLSNIQRLADQYEGAYIAILHGAVVDSDVDFSELAKRVYDRHGYRDIFMPKVGRRLATSEIRSPRIIPGPRP